MVLIGVNRSPSRDASRMPLRPIRSDDGACDKGLQAAYEKSHHPPENLYSPELTQDRKPAPVTT